MTEIWFYHLQRRSLEDVLPGLLERALQRGWRAVVQGASDERIAALDEHLWTYSDDSFLPHASAREGDPEMQPIFLTTGSENPNGATVRFLIEGAEVAPVLERNEGYARIMLLFDGNDAEALAAARAQWADLKARGNALSYWQQSADGKWEKRG
ncbi:MAG: DNA polymerase III subunit chi [Methylobacteriaceae bacterium]|nr:DNA polymerase III subunit chi [Methylobacteriaceae bacterium]